MDVRILALLTAGHCLVDLCQGAVPALLPVFRSRYGLDYQAAGVLVLAASVASSVVQPLFGLFADRLSAPWLLPAGVLATAGGLMAAVVAPGYGLAVAAAAVSGLGVAAFHPEAARMVYLASGPERTTGMSYFSVGGGVGFALAPLVVALSLKLAGPNGLLALLAPTVLVAALFTLDKPRFTARVRQHPTARKGPAAGQPARWRAFALLGGVIAIRSTGFFGINAYLVPYWASVGGSTEAGYRALAAVLVAGVVGTVVGGRLADRWGRRAVIRSSLLLGGGLLALLAAAPDVETAAWLLVPLGTVLFGGASALIVLGQEYLPGRVGVASGVTIGLAVTCGGLAMPPLGRAADIHGVGVVPGVLAVMTLAAGLLSLGLPRPDSPHLPTQGTDLPLETADVSDD